ncbi:hypothetical protein GP2143_06360 [marine gamma proteobacterium HTCC2143]|uniref:Uncharacterized protein n=1 Tax=marine gamma proteobacterium HTCC2143 TaxID=247633 RepID=A0YBX2_9GAMM|nr:hypothetical protein GP2143_06360 [marine gamma proteobacterium HTCC2143]
MTKKSPDNPGFSLFEQRKAIRERHPFLEQLRTDQQPGHNQRPER